MPKIFMGTPEHHANWSNALYNKKKILTILLFGFPMILCAKNLTGEFSVKDKPALKFVFCNKSSEVLTVADSFKVQKLPIGIMVQKSKSSPFENPLITSSGFLMTPVPLLKLESGNCYELDLNIMDMVEPLMKKGESYPSRIKVSIPVYFDNMLKKKKLIESVWININDYHVS